jgi:hypothetical protein
MASRQLQRQDGSTKKDDEEMSKKFYIVVEVEDFVFENNDLNSFEALVDKEIELALTELRPEIKKVYFEAKQAHEGLASES